MRPISFTRLVKITRPLAVVVVVTLSGGGGAQADGLVTVDQAIFGMDCAPCAYGIEQGLKKLAGSDTVRVSLNEGKAVVTFKPDSPTTLEQIRDVIRHNGFTPKAARVTVDGRLSVRDGALWLVEAGRDRAYKLRADDAQLQATLRTVPPETAVRLDADAPEDDVGTLLVRGRLR